MTSWESCIAKAKGEYVYSDLKLVKTGRRAIPAPLLVGVGLYYCTTLTGAFFSRGCFNPTMAFTGILTGTGTFCSFAF